MVQGVPDVVEDVTQIDEHVNCIIAIAHSIGGEGFTDMSEEEVHELFVDNEDLTEEDLVDMLVNRTIEIDIVDEQQDTIKTNCGGLR